MQPYELKPDEIVQPLSFTEGGRRYDVKHFLRVPALKDWAEYDAALHITLADVETAGGTGLAHRDNRTAALGMLWDRLAVRVEGYAPSEHWKDAVPFLHRVAAAQVRTLVVAVPAPDPSPDREEGVPEQGLYTPGLIPVYLLAAGGDYGALVHWFRQPDAAQTVEFNRLHAQRIYIRATRREGAKAVIPSMLPQYVALYDQLIERVDGYTVNGEGTTREQAVQSMDAWHKAAALKGFFLPSAPEEAVSD